MEKSQSPIPRDSDFIGLGWGSAIDWFCSVLFCFIVIFPGDSNTKPGLRTRVLV